MSGPRAGSVLPGATLSKNRSSSTGTGMTSVLFRSAGHLDHRLEQPELEGGRVAGHHVSRRGQALGRLVLAVGGDDPGAPLPLGLGLARHRPLHALGQRHVLDLDPLDPDSPRAPRWARR